MSLQSKMWLWINQIKIRQTTNNYKSQHLVEHSFLFGKSYLNCLSLFANTVSKFYSKI